jgi:hypothetical protein
VWQRGQELAERAQRDLLGFPSHTVTRAAALVLVEGLRDCWFRRYGVERAPRPPQEYDFGTPEPFVPQRHRVRSQLKTAGGVARALIRMCDARNWYKAFFPVRGGRAGQVDAAPEA